MIRVIYNPVAGPKMVRKIGSVREILSAGKNPVEIRETAGPGDAVLLAREAAHAGMEAAIAVGGDGTVNEVANGLAGSTTRLLVVPHGTGNVFADEVGLPESVEGCLSLLSAGKTIAVRLAKAGEGAEGGAGRYRLPGEKVRRRGDHGAFREPRGGHAPGGRPPQARALIGPPARAEHPPGQTRGGPGRPDPGDDVGPRPLPDPLRRSGGRRVPRGSSRPVRDDERLRPGRRASRLSRLV